MQAQRQTRRIEVDIPVSVTAVLDSFEASIVDLSEDGAQITGCSVPTGQRFRIDYRGEAVFAICRWSEVDRMGIKFLYPLTDGPLHERLMMARASQIYDDTGAPVASMPGHARSKGPAARTFSRAPLGVSFGRRH